MEPLDREGRLSAFLNSLIVERLEACFYRRLPISIRRVIEKRNAFYAKVLIHAWTKTEISLVSFNEFQDEDLEALFQKGLFLYEKWTGLGIDKAALNYGQLMNRLLVRTPFSREEANELLLPDICKDAPAVVQYLQSLGCAKEKSSQPIGKKTKIRKT